MLSIAAFFAAALSTFYWHEEVFAFLLAPADGKLSPFDGKPIVTVPTGGFGATLGISLSAGKIAAIPVFAVGIVALAKPLMPHSWWQRFLAINVTAGFTLFTLGCVFVYYVMLPVSMRFLLSYADDTVVYVITLEAYLEMVFALFRWIGLIFLIPLGMNMLARTGQFSYPRVKALYRLIFFLTLFFSALISPGLDPVLTVMVAVPMYSLYLVGLGGVWVVRPETGNFLWFWTMKPWYDRLGITWLSLRVAALAVLLIEAVVWLVDAALRTVIGLMRALRSLVAALIRSRHALYASIRLEQRLWRLWLRFWRLPERIGYWLADKIANVFSR